MPVLVTGATGFVGQHLVAAFTARGADVTALARRPATFGASDARVIVGDMLLPSVVDQALEASRPALVVHLAGVTAPTTLPIEEGTDGLDGFGANLALTSRLLHRLVDLSPDSRLLLVSSSAVYADQGPAPIDEHGAIRPRSAYGVSKATQELVAFRFQAQYGQPGTVVRPFNMVGPGQPDHLLISSLARQAVEAERRGGGVIRAGNLLPRRDYVDVRDVASALCMIAESRVCPDVLNVASGISRSVQECVDLIVGMTRVHVDLESDNRRMRKADLLEQVGSSSLLKQCTGWSPTMSIAQSCSDLLAYWRRKLGLTEDV
jgi:GDP-4-dehydro-6-deoxy-D-mannose reductase